MAHRGLSFLPSGFSPRHPELGVWAHGSPRVPRMVGGPQLPQGSPGIGCSCLSSCKPYILSCESPELPG